MKSKDMVCFAALSALLYARPTALPVVAGIIAAGLCDFQRSRQFDAVSWRRYFLGNGTLTWLLSPFNLAIDMLCRRNLRVYRLSDLPDTHREEVSAVIAAFRENFALVESLACQMSGKKRGMCFLRWYGRRLQGSLCIPGLDRDFKYVQTIGCSVFNQRQRTSVHYGPLRLTLRCLYNLAPDQHAEAFIDVAGKRHYWRHDPLFIFDDTLVHQSVNDSDRLRYCVFLDVLRPSPLTPLLRVLVKSIGGGILFARRVFYANWDMLR
ncbi:aspartyl/asparaginyl beta-hydroxylase domain-containing protein [Paraburkholderia edwinii]|uniref:Aspartyl/asparaginyl beta-hydroxylase domain-containing protein n=1 Tax=Paraburkholderia edwinii TaxID=2861782 RepID=A0ABX8UVP3_9BURK|nr:aspartyl/asparaginyl beta-hydroxylase domain-containing protein [Paraburkholderia edwinii]QYD71427.1 aspartyl/asparaginyl beta-hydroxylase domain-containing protein [Paraburkholderia edwinii]